MKRYLSHSAKIAVLGLILTTATPTHTRDSDNFLGDLGAVLIGAGCVAAAIGTAVWALSDESTESLIQRSNEACRIAAHSYEEFYASRVCTSIHSADERLLYRIAPFVGVNGNVQWYQDKLTTIVQKLRSLNIDINKRIATIRPSRDYYEKRHLGQLLALEQEITNGLYNLEHFQRFIEHHKDYFAFFVCEAAAYKKYCTELDTLNVHGQSYYAESVIKSACSAKNSTYPYISTHQHLVTDIERLKKLAHRVDRRHQERVGWGNWLIDQLMYINRVIVTSAEYQHDKICQERARLEEERLRIERAAAKARAEAERARHEMERAAREMREAAARLEYADCHHHTRSEGIDATVTVRFK